MADIKQKSTFVEDDLYGPPSDREVRSVLDAIKQAKSQTATPVDQKQFDQAEAEAQQLYTDRADRAEWLSLASRIGNALTRIGAAQTGLKTGVDMSQINYGPGYDASAAEQRAARDYGMSLESTGRKRRAASDVQKSEQDQLDREASSLMPEYEFQKFKYGQDTDTYQQSLKDKEAFKRRQEDLRQQAALEDRREKEREARAAKLAQEQSARQQASLEASEAKQAKAIQVGDYQKQLNQATEEARAVTEAAAILSSSEDLSKKSAEKLMAKYPQAMARAGITPEQMSAIEEQATEKGIIWDSVDPKKRQQLIQDQLVKPKIERINNLRQALDQIIGGQKSAAPTPPPTVRMRHKESGAERDVTPEEAAKLPKDQFEQVN